MWNPILNVPKDCDMPQASLTNGACNGLMASVSHTVGMRYGVANVASAHRSCLSRPQVISCTNPDGNSGDASTIYAALPAFVCRSSLQCAEAAAQVE